MLERARQATAAERIGNVVYQVGDAQTHQFASGAFDVVISRFGTMFRRSGRRVREHRHSHATQRRLVLLVWQRSEDNEWAQAIDGALGGAAQPPSPGADPFSLGDAEATARLLERAGLDGLRFEDVREPVFYGHDIDDALETVRAGLP
jgi:hypothetical protein